ncbi:hypothetical protein ANCDUO_00673 [Ancylostoma duodenale]|uniref:Phlebovirus glycoprotein G2 fusion domain-containing protein n=1 Tax=Ancylostoma duodenale TaxID=51022 RepID=A0A0C2DG93_9BILA|nr:hypothetical protein ANCDUO_00673 [Ancylostoma duodenale]
MEGLTTLLTEIEGTLNTRPLTYQEEHWDDHPSIRPIDFIQRDVIITYPLEGLEATEGDPEYITPEEALQLRTRRQAEQALRSSYQLTERFWKIWREEYITALREQHTRYLASNYGTPKPPRSGAVVLIADPNLPRNTWKMGRVVATTADKDGVTREVEIVLPSRRKTRRPVNLLVSLEIDNGKEEVDELQEHFIPDATSDDEPHDRDEMQQDDSRDHTAPESVAQPSARYNLRQKPRVNYDLLHSGGFLTTICLLGLMSAVEANATPPRENVEIDISGSLECTTKGILVTTSNVTSYELCSEGYCVIRDNPPEREFVHLPPEVTLHKHVLHWKISKGMKIRTVRVTCPATPFCEQVDCWFCTANLFNPECNPRAVIVTMEVIIYGIVALLYTLCYVPVVLGLPIRVMLIIALTTLRFCGRLVYLCYRGMRKAIRRRTEARTSTIGFVPIILIACAVIVQACQDVDVFEMRATTCLKSSDNNETCRFDITQMLKMNTYHREACFRLHKGGALLKEIRPEWMRLQLICDKHTLVFTRHTRQKVVNAKRCPRSGSCKGTKCAGINTTALLPELSQGNEFPGVTHCVESCGGPGCGCFYLSSGCLFYRIYATPVNNKVYEIFNCPRWREEVVLTISVTELTKDALHHTPMIPQNIGTMKITLTPVTVTPTPALHASFITDGNNTARWMSLNHPTLLCSSVEEAENLECEMNTNCKCEPAEDSVNCICVDTNITEQFNSDLRNRLPVQHPWIEFEEHHSDEDFHTVKAIVPSLSTAELLVTIREDFDSTTKEVTDSLCTVEDTTERKEEIEKAYTKLCRTGMSLIDTAFDERDQLQEEVNRIRQQKGLDASSIVKDLRELHQQQLSVIEENWKQMKDWQKNIDNTIEALLKLKTPCALTKAELINTVRKEYDSFRNHQQFLMDSSPKPVTREDLQPILDDQKRVHDTIARMEEKINQNSKDLAQTMNAVELLTKEIQALREVHQECHTEKAQKEHSKESKRSTTPEPRVRSMVTRPHSPGEPSRRHTDLERDPNRNIGEQITRTREDLSRVKRDVEEALRSNRSDCNVRIQELDLEKMMLIAQKDRLIAEAQRSIRRTRHCEESQKDCFTPCKRTLQNSRDPY